MYKPNSVHEYQMSYLCVFVCVCKVHRTLALYDKGHHVPLYNPLRKRTDLQ